MYEAAYVARLPKFNFTPEAIEQAKKQYRDSLSKRDQANILHPGGNNFEICFNWLAAQEQTRTPTWKAGVKHLIEGWAGHYVSRDDAGVAAILLKLQGAYGSYNLSKRLTLPSPVRIRHLEEVGKMHYSCNQEEYTYEEFWVNALADTKYMIRIKRKELEKIRKVGLMVTSPLEAEYREGCL